MKDRDSEQNLPADRIQYPIMAWPLRFHIGSWKQELKFMLIGWIKLICKAGICYRLDIVRNGSN